MTTEGVWSYSTTLPFRLDRLLVDRLQLWTLSPETRQVEAARQLLSATVHGINTSGATGMRRGRACRLCISRAHMHTKPKCKQSLYACKAYMACKVYMHTKPTCMQRIHACKAHMHPKRICMQCPRAYRALIHAKFVCSGKDTYHRIAAIIQFCSKTGWHTSCVAPSVLSALISASLNEMNHVYGLDHVGVAASLKLCTKDEGKANSLRSQMEHK
jgi:hypothetical protein